MTDVPEQAGGELREGKGRHPPPMMNLRLFVPLVVLAMPFGHCLFGMENSQGNLDAFSRCKPFRIPGPNLASPFFPTLGFHQRENALGILKEHPVLSPQDSNDIFPMLQAEVDKWGFHVKGIDQDDIKESSIATEGSFQEPFTSNHLSFPRSNHLHVQRHCDRETD